MAIKSKISRGLCVVFLNPMESVVVNPERYTGLVGSDVSLLKNTSKLKKYGLALVTNDKDAGINLLLRGYQEELVEFEIKGKFMVSKNALVATFGDIEITEEKTRFSDGKDKLLKLEGTGKIVVAFYGQHVPIPINNKSNIFALSSIVAFENVRATVIKKTRQNHAVSFRGEGTIHLGI